MGRNLLSPLNFLLGKFDFLKFMLCAVIGNIKSQCVSMGNHECILYSGGPWAVEGSGPCKAANASLQPRAPLTRGFLICEI